MVADAERDYEGFWARLARENLSWKKPFTRTLNEDNAPFYKWFEDGQLNVSYNCLDRNIENGLGDKTAIIFEADDGTVTKATYKELHEQVCKFANGLKAKGITKGDRVIIYMSMSVEGVAAMQACARIGATHSVVFGGFSAKSLAGTHHRCRRRGRHHGRRATARWQEAAIESHRRRSAGAGRLRLREERDCVQTHGQRLADGRGRDTWLHDWSTRGRNANRNGSMRNIRCSSCTPPVRRARPKACSIRAAAICCGPR